MTDFYSKGVSVKCEEYALYEDVIYVPSDLGRSVKYTITLNFRDSKTGWFLDDSTLKIREYTFVLVNSKSNFKYFLKNTKKPVSVNGYDFQFEFEVDQQTGESDIIDYIESTIISDVGIVSVCRTPITLYKLKKVSTTFKHKSKKSIITESNLIDERGKLGFASWSTVDKNPTSVATKITEAVHKHLYSISRKASEYLRMSYSKVKESQTFSKILVDTRPQSIQRSLKNSKENLIESFDMFNSIRSLDVVGGISETSLSSVILEPYNTNTSEIQFLNTLLPNQLYLRLLDTSKYDSVVSVIKGLDEFEVEMTETILIRSDIWVRVQGSFDTIESISGVEVPVEVANYIDFNNDHYVDNNPYINPHLLGGRGKQPFKPSVVVKENNNKDRNVLVIKEDVYSEKEVYKYSFEKGNITSVYLTEDLDLLYTVEKDDKCFLNSCKLGLDYSKKIGDKTSNNNPFVVVSDIRPFIGDWVDVIVDLKSWIKKVSSNSFLIQITNKDSVYYYNPETETLTTERTYIYKNLISIETPLEFSIFVENNDSYTITLYNENQQQYCSATTRAELITPYATKELESNLRMILKDNKIMLIDNTEDFEGISFSEIPDNEFIVILNVIGRSYLDYGINFNGYEITSNGSTIDVNSFENISTNKSSKRIIIKLKKDELKALCEGDINFKIGCTYNSDYSTKEGITKLIVMQKGSEFEVDLSPKLLPSFNDNYEYKITVNSNGITGERL